MAFPKANGLDKAKAQGQAIIKTAVKAPIILNYRTLPNK